MTEPRMRFFGVLHSLCHILRIQEFLRFVSMAIIGVLLTSFSFAEEWVPVIESSLTIAPGSVLDFSHILPTQTIHERLIVNKHGDWVKPSAPEQPLRFLMASIGMTKLPDHALIDRYVEQLRLHGYTMARLDFLEWILMSGQSEDFGFNATQLDRFHYLVYALKQAGIYLILNGLSDDNGGYGGIAERWVNKKGLHLGVYFDRDKQQHWKSLLSAMYASKNPYTHLSTFEDPVLAGMILVNEGAFAFLGKTGIDPSVQPFFNTWLLKRYGNEAKLKQAWGSELRTNEQLSKRNIELPGPNSSPSPRMSDAQRFYWETEKNTLDWMTAFVRQQGYQGFVAAFNNWHSPAVQAIRGELAWVDMHHYFAHPEYLPNQATKVRQDSMLADGASYIRELAMARHSGKPFTVTEFGQVFWNPYRREASVAIPAYAALQGWSGICQHATAIDFGYRDFNGQAKRIQDFRVGVDPIARATETLAALMFSRGDVAIANKHVSVLFGEQEAFKDSSLLGSVPSDVSKLALVTGVGLGWKGNSSGVKAEGVDGTMAFSGTTLTPRNLVLSKGVPSEKITQSADWVSRLEHWVQDYAGTYLERVRKAPMIKDIKWSARLAALKQSNWFTSTNLTNAEQGIYHSDTQQIVFDSRQRLLSVVTPKTEALVFDRTVFPNVANIKLDQLTLLSASDSATVAISTLDNQPIASSHRMIVVLATDARNSEMRFADSTESVATDMGHLPVLIKVSRVEMLLRHQHADQLTLYACNLRGERMEKLALAHQADAISFTLDISKLKHGATTYFELVLEPSTAPESNT